MSIATRTGDGGTTGLMYNRRVPKCHPRIEACGAVDELNACLGLARAATREKYFQDTLAGMQKDLVILMGELATEPADLARYVKDGFKVVTAELTATLDGLVAKLEANQVPRHDWAMPGHNACAAALDLARTVCRRAERRVSALQEDGSLNNAEVLIYLNRLADVLWLLARRAEGQGGSPSASNPPS